MNKTQKPYAVAASGGFSTNARWRVATMLAALAVVPLAQAGVFVKANNTDNLNLATSWVNNAVPGAADVAQWDSTVSDAGNASVSLGANASWSGIKILNPAAAINIANDGSMLTLGADGIDLSAASVGLTLNNNVTLLGNTVQSWSVASGQTLALNGTFTRAGGAGLYLDTSLGGTININGGTASAALNYSLVNGTDVGALDASKNVSTVGAVIGYSQSSTPTSDQAADQYLDVVNGSGGPASDVIVSSASYYPLVVRFNTPNPYRNYWIYDSANRNEYISTQTTFLVTTNVGAQDIIITGTYNTFRWNSGTELIINQQNTAGTLYANGPTSQRVASANNILTKYGAGRAVMNTALANNGPIRIIEGELTLNSTIAASSSVQVGPAGVFSGSTTINNPVTVFGGTIHPGSTNGLEVLTLGNLTLNAGSSLSFYNTTSPVTNTAALLNLTGAWTIGGPVNVRILAGYTPLGQYPLVHWTNAISATDFTNFTLAQMPLRTTGYLSNNVANDSIDLVVTNVNQPIKWATGNGTWDVNSTANWVDTQGGSTTYQQSETVGDQVLFNDSAPGTSPITVTLNQSVVPAGATIDAAKDYIITGSGDIAGGGSVTKAGAGTLTLQTTNSFAGGLNLNGGVVKFGSFDNLGSGGINFGGGTLQYPAGFTEDLSTRTVSFVSGQGTIDDNGNNLTFASAIGNNGSGGFTKMGAGTLLLSGTNSYTGPTIIAQGTLALNPDAYISNSSAIMIDSGAVLDGLYYGGAFNLTGTPGQILGGDGAVAGYVTCDTGTLMPGTNGIPGTLTFSNDLTFNGGVIEIDLSNDPAQRDLLNIEGGLYLYGGTLNLNVHGTLTNGVYRIIRMASGLYSGAGSSANLKVTGFSQPGQVATLDDSTPNEIDVIVTDAASDDLVWSGSGSYWDTVGSLSWLKGGVSWSFTNGDTVTFNDSGLATPTVYLQSAVLPSSVTVNNSAGDYTFADGTGTGGGKISGLTSLVKDGTGTLTVAAENNYSGATTIKNGTLQIGSGGAGGIGSGPVTNNAALVFNQGGDYTVNGKVSGTGSLTQSGTATLTLKSAADYTGPTTITSGTLQVGTGGSAGVLMTSSITNDGTLILNSTTDWNLAMSMTGSGILWKQGTNTVTLTGANTRTGQTRVDAGKLVLGASNYATGPARIEAGGTLDINGFDQTFAGLSGGTYSGRLVNNGGTGTNVVTITNAATSDSDVVIADNDGSGGAIAVVKLGAGELIERAASTYSGGTWIKEGTVNIRTSGALGSGPVTFSGGTLTVANGGNVTNPEIISTNGTLNANGNIYVNCPITGDSTGVLNITAGSGNTVTPQSGCDLSGFAGTIRVPGPNPLYLRLDAPVGGASVTWDVGTNCTLLQRSGNRTTYLGHIVGGDTSIIEGGGGGTTTYIIGGKNLSGAYPGTIQDNGSVTTIVKEGTGTLTLNGTNAWSGSTIVSNGVLAVMAPASLTNSAVISVAAASATLDVSQLTVDSLFEVNSGQTLSGFGTVLADNVKMDDGSTLSVGLPTGVLSMTNNLEVAGAVVFNLVRTNTTNSGELVVPNLTIDSTATLTITNVGPALANGDKFTLFDKAVNPNQFASVTLPATDPTGTTNYVWQNDLAVDGTITLVSGGVSPINQNPPTIQTSFSGNMLSLSWPTNSGWILQMQTNNLATGISNNWVDVSGSENMTSTNITVDASAPTVFYRLRLP